MYGDFFFFNFISHLPDTAGNSHAACFLAEEGLLLHPLGSILELVIFKPLTNTLIIGMDLVTQTATARSSTVESHLTPDTK